MKALLVVDMLRDFIDADGALTTGPAGVGIVDFIEKENSRIQNRGLSCYLYM